MSDLGNEVEKKEIKFRINKDLSKQKSSKVEQYCDLIVGQRGFLNLFKFELIQLFCGWIPGALGLFLRSKLYPFLFKKCGKGVVFGQNLTLRHPQKIELGDQVILDDYVMLDAKGEEGESGISIDSECFLGRYSILSCKNGRIELGQKVVMGFHCEIFSGSLVKVGQNTLIAAYTYLIGGGHEFEDKETVVYEQSSPSYGIELGENCWLGAAVKIQDGVTIGESAVIGTGAVVTKSIEPFMVATGVPAKVIRERVSS